MTITAKMTEYNSYISTIEVTRSPSTWLERNVLKLKPTIENIRVVAGHFWREDGDLLTGFSSDTKQLYEVVFNAHTKGLFEQLQKLTA